MVDLVILGLLVLASTAPLSKAQQPPAIQLQADPRVLVPGLTPTLTVTCGPGQVASQYREIFLLQILGHVGGKARVLATLQSGHAPTLSDPDPRVKVNGSLDMLVPDTAVLRLSVDRPSDADAGTVECEVVGLSKDGTVLKRTDTLDITVHAESGLVSPDLKNLLGDMKREVDSLLARTLALRQQNQHLSQLNVLKEAALEQKKGDLQQLKRQVQSFKSREEDLKHTAHTLAQAIDQVYSNSPAQRAAFNALKMNRTTSNPGNEVPFEAVALNEGQGYNRSTSVFRPPVNGVYYLTASLLLEGRHAFYSSFAIMVNSTVVGGALNSDDRQGPTVFRQSRTSTLVSLSPYDLVSVSMRYSSSSSYSPIVSPQAETRNERATNFAGYLLN